MRDLMQHCSLSGHRLMGQGTHCIRERGMEEESTLQWNSHRTHSSRKASHKHKLPASINSSPCMSHLCERLNRNKWSFRPAAGAWQETDSIWPGDPRTGVTTVERGDCSADLRATLEKTGKGCGLDADGLRNKVVLFLDSVCCDAAFSSLLWVWETPRVNLECAANSPGLCQGICIVSFV